MKKWVNTLIIIMMFFLTSCNDDLFGTDSSKQGSVNMSACSFPNYVSSTRTTLTPTESGTSFSWNKGDVCAVYSSGKGLTNFFIDENSISDDGSTASFNGSGFSLMQNSVYYAFYPYSASSLEKNRIPVTYNGQNMAKNGDFESLSYFDYMYAKGTTTDIAEVGFNFNHLGCVVDFKLQVPVTAIYEQVRLELEPNTDVSLIKRGVVDITSNTPSIQSANLENVDSVLCVFLNRGEGFLVEKDDYLHVYMMMAPQNLSNHNIVIRLVDMDKNWYTITVPGKNMLPSYTYHYSVGENMEYGGFTGTGTGLPNGEMELSPLLKSVYHYQGSSSSYFHLIPDNSDLYALGGMGVLKLDCTNPNLPVLTGSNKIGTGKYGHIARSGVVNSDKLYIGVRNSSGYTYEYATPCLRLKFEGDIKSFDQIISGGKLTNNNVVNSFFRSLSISSLDKSVLSTAWLYKAAPKNGKYRNAILLTDNNSNMVSFYGKYYDTEEEALNALTETYSTNAGDICNVDWDAIPIGANAFKNLVFGRGISNNGFINNFFTLLHTVSYGQSEFNTVYIYKGLPQNGKYKNAILLSNGGSKSISFLSSSYNSKEEALSKLVEEYRTNNGDFCRVNWDEVTNESNVLKNIKFVNLGEFDSFELTGGASMSQVNVPCPNTGQRSLWLKSNGIGQAIAKTSIGSTIGEGELSFWLSCEEISSMIEIPLLENNDVVNLSIFLEKDGTQKYKIYLKNGNNYEACGEGYTFNEWYNFKVVFSRAETKMYYRTKEAGNWVEGTNVPNSNSILANTICCGIKTSGDGSVYIDDFYYNESNLDACSYINGKLIVLDKESLTELCTYNFDTKCTGMGVHGNTLVLNFLWGFNVYDVTDKGKPILAYTYRHPTFKEFQGCDFYEHDGRTYCVICNYVDGITIVDVTNPYQSKIIATDNSTEFTSAGKYNFDCAVSYPYVYTTYAVQKNIAGTLNDRRGVLVYDISNTNNINCELFEMPISDVSTCIDDGDLRPTRLTKYGNRIVVNNGDKGVAVFDITAPGKLNYNCTVPVDSKTSTNPVVFGKEGLLFVAGQRTTSCPNADIYIYSGF